MPIHIRALIEQDLPALTAIYNEAVRHSLAIWNEQLTTVHERRQWWRTRLANQFPVLAAADERNRLVGYASYGPWRAFEGYRFTVEHSIYIAQEQRKRGIGQQLLTALINKARLQKLHVMIAAIESDNVASIKLHQRFQFDSVGYLPQVGKKFGKWLDLVFMQLILSD